MAQPQAYNRETDFTERDGDDTNHAGINTELDAAALSINEIRDNLALIQRDDGALQNGIVTAESLAPTAFDAFKGDLNEAVADAQTAATSANNAALSANTARDQAVAAKDTAVTSANAAALNATTATTKAAESAASATAAQASATASGNSASASQTSRLASEAARDASQAAQAAAAASQTATATSEANASASAATATAQAGIATTQAGIATTQASNAAASATAAAASFDQFDDRYLGSKTVDPTVDNDGNALLTGALYFNSVANEMRVYAGTFWKATGSSVDGTINTANYTATAGQTTFAIVYDVGFVHVYLNGLKLESGVDFTANNGTSVVLTTGATAGDVVDMIAFGIFSVANTYTKAEADTLLAAKANQASTYTKTEVDTADALKLNAANPSYTGTLTGGTGVVNLGSGQFYKDASGNVNIGSTSNYGGLLSVNRPQTSSIADLLTLRDASSGTAFNLQTYGDPTFGTANRFNFDGAYLSFRRSGVDLGRFDSSGNFLVGTTTPPTGASSNSFYTTVSGRWPLAARGHDRGMSIILGASEGYGVYFERNQNAGLASTGYIYLNPNNTTNYSTTSDYRLKENIQPMTGALARVAALKPVTYKWKIDGSDGQGFIAHELQAVVPDCVTGEKDAMRVEQYQIGTRKVTKQRQVTDKTIVLEDQIVLVNGVHVLRKVEKVVEQSLFEQQPVFNEDGAPAMVDVPEVLDEEGNVVTPATQVQRTVDVPVIEEYEEDEPVMGEREVPSYQGIDTSFLVATLTAAIQEQQAIISALTSRIDALESAA
jgi:Chaperone of endosialidase